MYSKATLNVALQFHFANKCHIYRTLYTIMGTFFFIDIYISNEHILQYTIKHLIIIFDVIDIGIMSTCVAVKKTTKIICSTIQYI